MTESEVLIKTPEEAIETIKSNMPTSGYQMLRESLDMAISALKEIQLYKDNKLCLIPEDVYSRQCSELDAYKEIGTVEECREAVEKQVNRMNEICDKCLTCHWYCDDVLEECKGQEEPCHEYSPCMEIRRVGEPNE